MAGVDVGARGVGEGIRLPGSHASLFLLDYFKRQAQLVEGDTEILRVLHQETATLAAVPTEVGAGESRGLSSSSTRKNLCK